MNKKNVFILAAAISLGIGALAMITVNPQLTKYNESPLKADDPVDCSRYLDERNGYTSIFDIVANLNSGVSQSYKTWGTVTKVFSNTNGTNKQYYIQSTDKNGKVAGILIYNSPVSVVEGNVITITGTPILYNNMPEFNAPSEEDITIDYSENNYAVETYETDYTFWKNGADETSTEFKQAEAMGTRKVSINDVILNSVSTSSANVSFYGTSVSLTLYYSSVQNTSAINTYLTSIKGQTIDVVGILNCYLNSGNAAMQLLVRDVEDITTNGESGGEETDYTTLTIDETNYSFNSQYNTGNYGKNTVSGFSFQYYRAITGSNDNFVKLIPNLKGYNDGSAPGAIYNTEAIKGIHDITITYTTNLTSGAKPSITYGLNSYTNTSSLALSTSSKTTTVIIDNANYFKIETSEAELSIERIEINYANTSSSSTSFNYVGYGINQYRINPITFNGTPSDGDSVTVPTSITRSGNSYTVNSSKTYTYYTLDYIKEHTNLKSQAAMIEPEDVAAFYTIFKTNPANYATSSNISSVKSVFGSDAREVSHYTKTTGYATSVPYAAKNGAPSYYEFDIDVDGSYSTSSRGVGRVVAWEYGFDTSKGATNYSSAPVCVFTDDHYFTFQEFLNYGSFGPRFNVEGNPTNYIWGVSTTLNPLN
jgi:hypothetical protein